MSTHAHDVRVPEEGSGPPGREGGRVREPEERVGPKIYRHSRQGREETGQRREIKSDRDKKHEYLL